METLKILIADDELPAREKIKSYMLDYDDKVELYEAGDGFETVKIINEINPDLIFLDIQMPKANGLEVIDAIGIDEMPAIVFVTAYDQYAIEAFNVEAVDYLLKPFDQDRFKRAFIRAKEKINSSSNNNSDLREIFNRLNSDKKYLERIMVEKVGKYKFVTVSEIVFINAQDKYIELNTENEKFLVRDTMSRIEDRLDPDKFKRTHRSFIVNLEYIKEIQPWGHGDYILLLKNGNKIKLARRFKENVFRSE